MLGLRNKNADNNLTKIETKINESYFIHMLPIAILAGGRGTRLRPLTEFLPKSLIDVNGEPFIAHQLRRLRESGISRVVLCVGILGDMIADFVGNGKAFGLQVEYSFDGSELLGTAGALRRAQPLLGERFFVVYGDLYLICPFHEIEDSFASCGHPAMMTVFRNEGRWGPSNVEYDDGRILAYDKGQSASCMHYIDYGLGVFDARVFSRSYEPELEQIYRDLLQSRELAAFEVHERFYEIGSFEGLADTAKFLRTRESQASCTLLNKMPTF